MAGPVITTLLAPSPAQGTQTTSASEISLASGTASGTYFLSLETVNMVDGDIIELIGYDKPGASTTKRQLFRYSLSNLQTDPGHQSPPIPTPGYIEFAIQRIAGTDRSYAWCVVNLNGT